MYEMKSIVCKIVRSFKLTHAKDNKELEIYSDLVLKPVNGINIKIEKRWFDFYFFIKFVLTAL